MANAPTQLSLLIITKAKTRNQQNRTLVLFYYPMLTVFKGRVTPALSGLGTVRLKHNAFYPATDFSRITKDIQEYFENRNTL